MGIVIAVDRHYWRGDLPSHLQELSAPSQLSGLPQTFL
jgi:hypothetical protein